MWLSYFFFWFTEDFFVLYKKQTKKLTAMLYFFRMNSISLTFGISCNVKMENNRLRWIFLYFHTFSMSKLLIFLLFYLLVIIMIINCMCLSFVLFMTFDNILHLFHCNHNLSFCLLFILFICTKFLYIFLFAKNRDKQHKDNENRYVGRNVMSFVFY